MQLFFYILQTIVKTPVIIYPDDPFSSKFFNLALYNETQHNVFYFINIIYYNSPLSKINGFYKYMTNSVLPNSMKNELESLFCKSQRVYYSFSKIASIYRRKKYKICVHDDLLGNYLNKYHKNTFRIIQNNSIYLFCIRDLIKIIENAAGNYTMSFFLEPLWPLNPYTKQPLLLSDLYNIYFAIKESKQVMPIIFHLFFISNFNLSTFYLTYEHIVRETAIKKYVYNSSFVVLYHDVDNMLNDNPYTRKLKIDKDFPRKELVDIFKNLIYYYMIINYGIHETEKISKYSGKLYTELRNFYNYNPLFGRKFYIIIQGDDKPKFDFNRDNIYNKQELKYMNVVYEDNSIINYDHNNIW